MATNGSIQCVLLADSHQVFTEGVCSLLETAFDAVIMVTNQSSLVHAATHLRPGLVVADLSLARAMSTSWIGELTKVSPLTKVLVLSVDDQPQSCRAALGAGAHGFVLKRKAGTDLFPALDALRAGRTFVTPGVLDPPGADLPTTNPQQEDPPWHHTTIPPGD